MTTKLIRIAPVSAVVLESFCTAIMNDPAATETTTMSVTPATPATFDEPDCCDTNTTSPIATVLLVTVNSALACAARDVVFVVIVPVRALIVTPVLRLVACVTAEPTPDPVA